MDATSAGPLVKAKETLRVFARAAPSVGDLFANRRSRFERAHPILPSTATAGEGVELLVQARDQASAPVRASRARSASRRPIPTRRCPGESASRRRAAA
ncbi:MAG: hypothetical protein ABEH78_00575 [Haloferacaceae archaeon]